MSEPNPVESDGFKAWRSEARALLQKGVPPEHTNWNREQPALFASEMTLQPLKEPKASAEFLKLAQLVACARDDDRWSLLYRLLFRLNHENPHLLKVTVDDDVRRVNVMAKSVSRDIHKMHAFVRFKRAEIEGIETFVAWHKPEHLIMEVGSPFFVRRFGDKPWSIFSPDLSAHWNKIELTFGPGMSQSDFAHEDPFDEVWKTYYKSIFNPARLKLKAMRAEMAPKYWSALPEAEIIQTLIRETPQRLQNMASAPVHLAVPPLKASWSELKEAAKSCAACPLAAQATQTVFGEGPLNARIMIVGEQPGDVEDIEGKSFVGPAGDVLNDALQLVGLQRESIYVTNAVKHFKFERQGKARIHKKASGTEMHACKPWLEQEIARIKPDVILCLGATAGTAVFGRLVKIQTERGKPYKDSGFAPTLLISWHPAAILRASSDEEQAARFRELVEDIQLATQHLAENPLPLS